MTECCNAPVEYQPYEPEVNAPESLSCSECGKDLPIQENYYGQI